MLRRVHIHIFHLPLPKLRCSPVLAPRVDDEPARREGRGRPNETCVGMNIRPKFRVR
jgi:hypothetical protein